MTPLEKFHAIIAELAKLGISREIACELALQFDLDLISEHIINTRRAIELKWVNNPAGWFIASLRGNWGPPTPPRRQWWDREFDAHVQK